MPTQISTNVIQWSVSGVRRAKEDSNGRLIAAINEPYGGDWEREFGIYVSTDGGATWTRYGATPQIHGYKRGGMEIGPNDNVHVSEAAYADDSNALYFELDLDHTNESLTVVTNETAVNGTAAMWSQSPVVMDDGTVFVVASSDTDTSIEINVARRDGADTWTTVETLATPSYRPSIVSDSAGNLHMAWYDDAGTAEIHYWQYDTDDGTTINETIAAGEGYPSITTISGTPYVVMDDTIYRRDGADNWASTQFTTSTIQSPGSHSVDLNGIPAAVYHDDTGIYGVHDPFGSASEETLTTDTSLQNPCPPDKLNENTLHTLSWDGESTAYHDDTDVAQPASFDVTITGTNSPITEGEILEVNYEVVNSGDETAVQDITLDVDPN